MTATSGNGPLVPQKRTCAPRRRNVWIGDIPPSKRVYFLGLLRVCMALKTLRCCGDSSSPEQRSALRTINTLNPPKKYIRLLGGLSPIHSMCRRGAQGLMWGTSGLFLPAVVMVGYGCVGDVGHWRLTSDQPNVGIVKIVYRSIFFIPT